MKTTGEWKVHLWHDLSLQQKADKPSNLQFTLHWKHTEWILELFKRVEINTVMCLLTFIQN